MAAQHKATGSQEQQRVAARLQQVGPRSPKQPPFHPLLSCTDTYYVHTPLCQPARFLNNRLSPLPAFTLSQLRPPPILLNKSLPTHSCSIKPLLDMAGGLSV